MPAAMRSIRSIPRQASRESVRSVDVVRFIRPLSLAVQKTVPSANPSRHPVQCRQDRTEPVGVVAPIRQSDRGRVKPGSPDGTRLTSPTGALVSTLFDRVETWACTRAGQRPRHRHSGSIKGAIKIRHGLVLFRSMQQPNALMRSMTSGKKCMEYARNPVPPHSQLRML